MDSIFKALSDKHRRRILEILKEKDMTVGEIAEHFTLTGATLSHHLDILKKARLVICQKEGRFRKYSLNTSVFEETVRMFLDVFKKI
jgi:ArsR family transcriptional regulator